MSAIGRFFFYIKTHVQTDFSMIPHNNDFGGWIYFIFDNDVLLYIGKAKDLKRRLSKHHIYKKNFHKVSFFAVPDMNEAEQSNIKRYNPPLNYDGKLQKEYRRTGLSCIRDKTTFQEIWNNP